MKNVFVRFFGCLTVTCLVTAAPSQAALSLVIEQGTPGNVMAGTIVPINIVLRGTRTSVINTVQLTLSPLTGGATFSTTTVADGFDESALAGLLSQSIDGSLTDNLTLAYGKIGSGSDTGILTGSSDVRIGTFYLSVPVGAASYPLSFSSIELSDPSFDVVDADQVGTTVIASVPEPTALAGAVGIAGLLTRRKRVAANP